MTILECKRIWLENDVCYICRRRANVRIKPHPFYWRKTKRFNPTTPRKASRLFHYSKRHQSLYASQTYRTPRPVITTAFSTLYISRSYFTTDSQSVSQYVLASSTLVGLTTRYYFLSEYYCLIWGAPSLTRGRVCNLQCNHSIVRVAQNP
jgi:hypothetical protein